MPGFPNCAGGARLWGGGKQDKGARPQRARGGLWCELRLMPSRGAAGCHGGWGAALAWRLREARAGAGSGLKHARHRVAAQAGPGALRNERRGASMLSCRCPGGPLPPDSVGCSLPRRAGRSAMPDAPPPPWPSSWSLAFSFVQRDRDRCSQPGPRPSLSVPGGVAAAVPPSWMRSVSRRASTEGRVAGDVPCPNCTCLSPAAPLGVPALVSLHPVGGWVARRGAGEGLLPGACVL